MVEMRRLKRTEVRQLKQDLIQKQGGVCPLCLKELPTELSKVALDHDHTTGECRGVLHLGCNRAEGSVFNTIARWGGQGKDYSGVVRFLEWLLEYLKTHTTGVVYHLHKTEQEQREARNRRARQARARRKAKQVLGSKK